MNMTQLARELGISRKTLYANKNKGMPVDGEGVLDRAKKWIACAQSPKTTLKNSLKKKSQAEKKKVTAEKLETKAEDLKNTLTAARSLLSDDENEGIEIGERVLDEQMSFIEEKMHQTREKDLGEYANYVRLFIPLIKEKLAIQKDISRILKESQKLIPFQVHVEMLKEQALFFITELERMGDVCCVGLVGEPKKIASTQFKVESDRIQKKLYDFVPEEEES